MGEKKEWYAVVVLPNREIAIRDRLRRLSQNVMLEGMIEDVRVITEMVEDKNGKLKEKIHKDYKQYVFVKMVRNDTTYHAIKIEGVRHILGSPEPVPLTPEEVSRFFGEGT